MKQLISQSETLKENLGFAVEQNWKVGAWKIFCCSLENLTQIRMGLFVAAHGWVGAKRPPFLKSFNFFWVFKDFFNKHDCNFDDVTKKSYSRPS